MTKKSLLAHEKSYVDRFFNNQLTDKERKRIGLTPWTESMIEQHYSWLVERWKRLIMRLCTVASPGIWLEGRIMRTEFGSGYCVFNDLAICALDAIEKQGIERVAILDLDVHQGDGTATILEDEKESSYHFSSLREKLPISQSK